MICFSVMMQSPQFEEVKKEQSYYHILEGLISHFFPETDSLYCKEDVEYFISFANKQTTWKHSVQTGHVAESNDSVLDNCISLSKFKFHLDKILCKGWSKNGKASKPLNLYKLEVIYYNYVFSVSRIIHIHLVPILLFFYVTHFCNQKIRL